MVTEEEVILRTKLHCHRRQIKRIAFPFSRLPAAVEIMKILPTMKMVVVVVGATVVLEMVSGMFWQPRLVLVAASVEVVVLVSSQKALLRQRLNVYADDPRIRPFLFEDLESRVILRRRRTLP